MKKLKELVAQFSSKSQIVNKPMFERWLLKTYDDIASVAKDCGYTSTAEFKRHVNDLFK